MSLVETQVPKVPAERSPHLDDSHDDEGVAEDGGEAGGVEGEGQAEAAHLPWYSIVRLNLVKSAIFQKWFFGVFSLEMTSLG